MASADKSPSDSSSVFKAELDAGENVNVPHPVTTPGDSRAKSWWRRVGLGNAKEEYQTQRGMKSRHLMMIAIGGTIGTGIFLGASFPSLALAARCSQAKCRQCSPSQEHFPGRIFDWGEVKGHPGPGLSNFHIGQAFIGGFGAFADFRESTQPHKSVPRAVKATFFHIVLFYILAILTMELRISWNDGTLLSAAYDSDVAASPITVVFVRAGFGAAVHVVNAILLTTRKQGIAESFRMGQSTWGTDSCVINGNGILMPNIPHHDVGSSVVFSWLLSITGISALLVWTSIGVISLRFRRAYKAKGLYLAALPHRRPLSPLFPVGLVILGMLMFIAQGYAAVVQDPFDHQNVVATYIGVADYVILYAGYTIYERVFEGRKSHFVPLKEVDFVSYAV
ncbi:amino acid permease-domain-containing protein [Cyathus striatus]|nr:amino acid permease-domain-containing protein [Cyathus striatus]